MSVDSNLNCLQDFTYVVRQNQNINYLYPGYSLKILHVSVCEGIRQAVVGVVHCREGVDVEPHASDVVAEDVVVVAFALRLDHAQVRHG